MGGPDKPGHGELKGESVDPTRLRKPFGREGASAPTSLSTNHTNDTNALRRARPCRRRTPFVSFVWFVDK